jgi:hypothetical protein
MAASATHVSRASEAADRCDMKPSGV